MKPMKNVNNHLPTTETGETGLSMLLTGLVTTSSKGLISAPKTAQLKHKAAKIKFAPFQPYWSNKKFASGAKTKVPTPEPQTAIP